MNINKIVRIKDIEQCILSKMSISICFSRYNYTLKMNKFFYSAHALEKVPVYSQRPEPLSRWSRSWWFIEALDARNGAIKESNIVQIRSVSSCWNLRNIGCGTLTSSTLEFKVCTGKIHHPCRAVEQISWHLLKLYEGKYSHSPKPQSDLLVGKKP